MIHIFNKSDFYFFIFFGIHTNKGESTAFFHKINHHKTYIKKERGDFIESNAVIL